MAEVDGFLDALLHTQLAIDHISSPRTRTFKDSTGLLPPDVIFRQSSCTNRQERKMHGRHLGTGRPIHHQCFGSWDCTYPREQVGTTGRSL